MDNETIDLTKYITISGYNGNNDIPRLYLFNDFHLDIEHSIFRHTKYYNKKESAFITIGKTVKENEIEYFDNIIKLPEPQELLHRLISIKNKSLCSTNSCVICYDDTECFPMPCCSNKQHICIRCIVTLYKNDSYNCVCCREINIIQFLDSLDKYNISIYSNLINERIDYINQNIKEKPDKNQKFIDVLQKILVLENSFDIHKINKCFIKKAFNITFINIYYNDNIRFAFYLSMNYTSLLIYLYNKGFYFTKISNKNKNRKITDKIRQKFRTVKE
jgi:hypothetical protein